MELKLALQGNLRTFLAAHNKALARVLTDTVRATGNSIRAGVRKQIRAGFGGETRQLQNALKQKNSPGYTLTPSAKITSKALYRGGKYGRRQDVDLLEAYTRQETVTAAGDGFLWIPTENAPWRGGRGGGTVHATPRGSGLNSLVKIKISDTKAILVQPALHGGKGIVMYIGVKAATRQKRLDIDAETERATRGVPAFFERKWMAESEKLSGKFGEGLDRGSLSGRF